MKQVKRSKIKENPNNPRIIKDHKYYLLVKSLQEFPEMLKLRPIVVDEDMMVLGGNKRLKASKDAGLKEVWIEIAEGLTEAQKKEFVIKDNTNYGEWDWDILANKWDSVQLIEWGVDVWENQDDIKAEPIAGLTDDDDVPEAEESICKAGDIWGLGNHRLLCGDATKKEDVERLMGGEKADMVFTDIPYGIDYSGGRSQTVARKSYGKIEGDKDKDISCFVKLVSDYGYKRDSYICVSPVNLKPVFEVIDKYDACIVWKKNTPGLGYQWVRRYCEFIVFSSNRKKAKHDNSEFDYWDISTDIKTEYKHGTQKPVALPTRAIEFSSVVNDLVVDYFLGSGSTLIACEKTNRKCYGMEIDPHYCDVIVKRWEEFTGNKAEKLDGKTEKV